MDNKELALHLEEEYIWIIDTFKWMMTKSTMTFHLTGGFLLSPDSKARLLLTCIVHRKNKEIAPLCTGHKCGQNQDARREATDARVHKEREDKHKERIS